MFVRVTCLDSCRLFIFITIEYYVLWIYFNLFIWLLVYIWMVWLTSVPVSILVYTLLNICMRFCWVYTSLTCSSSLNSQDRCPFLYIHTFLYISQSVACYFHSLNGIFWWTKVLNSKIVNQYWLVGAFCVLFKKILSTPKFQRYFIFFWKFYYFTFDI